MHANPMNNLDAHYNDPEAWIGVDLDGTWAVYLGWNNWDHIGRPLPLMTARVERWLAEGKVVKVFTARLSADDHDTKCRITGKKITNADITRVIQDWTEKVVGVRLPVTATKDLYMLELWDDRAIQMVPNTGRTLAEEHEAELTALKGKP